MLLQEQAWQADTGTQKGKEVTDNEKGSRSENPGATRTGRLARHHKLRRTLGLTGNEESQEEQGDMLEKPIAGAVSRLT